MILLLISKRKKKIAKETDLRTMALILITKVFKFRTKVLMFGTMEIKFRTKLIKTTSRLLK
jgi:hypothetical protein